MCALDVFHLSLQIFASLTLPSCSSCMDYISGLPVTSGIYWFGQWYPGDGRVKEGVRSGYFFPWLLPFKVSSGQMCSSAKS